MNHVLTLGLVLAAAVPAVAHADTEVDPTETTSASVTPPASSAMLAPTAPESPPRWYGADVLLVDGVALGLLVAGASLQSSGHDTIGGALLITGLGTYALGGPIVHLAHDRPERALGSLALRAALPAVTGFVGMAIDKQQCTGDWFCGLAGLAIGVVGGWAGAVALDSAVLAWGPRTDVRVSPMVGGGRLGLSVGGMF